MENQMPKQIIISENVLFQNIGSECVLLNMETEQYFGLDELAAVYWQYFVEDGDIQNAFNKVLNEYEVEEEVLRKDLLFFLKNLQEQELVTLIS